MAEKITQIYIGRGAVGLTGLAEIFQELARSPLESSDALQEDLLRRVAARNYVPPEARPAYRQALWREFRRFRGEEVEEEPASGLVIEVLGLGCAGCRSFYQGVMEILARHNIMAAPEYITDPARLKKFSIGTFPALVINGQVVLSGRIPSAAELAKLLAGGPKEAEVRERGAGR